MAAGGAPERSNPLHNFSLPRLRWGSQRHMRCVKIDSPNALHSLLPPPPPQTHLRRRRDGDAVLRKLGLGGEIDIDREMMLARKRFIDDLRTEMHKMRGTLSLPGSDSGRAAEHDDATRPRNFRTRRGACKAPADGEKAAAASPSPPMSNGAKTGLRSGAEKKKEEPMKLRLELTQKEKEADYIAMTGQPPPRRPKKRPRIVRNQIEMLLPGLWLTGITPERYEVPEIPDNAKR